MDRLIYHNGAIVDAADARIAVTSAGLVYGWGVFTNLRIYDGAIFALERHWERLTRHAQAMQMLVPISIDDVRQALNHLITANSTVNGRVRITLLKGDAGAWKIAQGCESELLIFTSSEPARPNRALAITLSPYRLLSHGRLAGIKRTAMLENLLALEEARSRGFSEAVMLNERGEIVGAATANIFWVEGGQLFTPSLATGCIAGVTRALVHLVAERMRLHIVEGGFPVQSLLNASEAFLTSTTREITPVASFDIKRYDADQARFTRLIGREFQKLVRSAKMSKV
jgi:branched-subunit amino acid aminotransferase/4-amino-4-deoxychorismate lyase